MTRFGYACISELTGLTTNHTCRLDSATPERLRALIAQNLDSLQSILKHNVANGWLLFRIGSSVIPFASHPVNQLQWWNEFAPQLRAIGDYARANHLRLSMHPGQYTVLSSPNENIRASARVELEYAAQFLDSLGVDATNKIVLHVGGTYNNKEAAVERFCVAVDELPLNVRARLVIENDQRTYNAAEVLGIAQQIGIPQVFDNLHHEANRAPLPLDELLPQIFATWRAVDGKPKVHFSSRARGVRNGKHAEYANPNEFVKWLGIWQHYGEFDVMLEAKGKDRALKKLLKQTNRKNV